MGRARASEGGGRRTQQYKRSTPTYEFRLHVIHHSDSHGVPSALAKFYPEATGSSLKTKRKNTYLQRKHRDTIEKVWKSSSSSVLRKLRPAGSTSRASNASIGLCSNRSPRWEGSLGNPPPESNGSIREC
ncbi:hypothetical protein KRP22_004033 [Phytophthora ramorum]|nr:hypothetical protein KRP22_9966 [Phytophthora ramorum]